jgi:hypothetical protein
VLLPCSAKHTCLHWTITCLQVCFVDLRPVPPTAKAVTPQGFSVLLSMLTGAEHLDGWDLSHAVDAADLEAKVSAQGGGEANAHVVWCVWVDGWVGWGR